MSAPARPTSVLTAWLDWFMLIMLVAALAWTTLCLGGYLAETMVWSSRLVLALAVVGSLRMALGRGDAPVAVNLAVLIPLPFIAYALASVLWIAPAQWLAWREWLGWLHWWVVFAVVLHVRWGRWQTAVLVIAIGGLGLAGVAMAAYQRYVDPHWLMLGRAQAEQFWARSGGMFGSPNSMAGWLEILIPACLVTLGGRTVSRVMKVACAWLGALFLFALMLTGSRGGWLSTLAALLLWPLLTGDHWRRRLGGAVVLVSLFLVTMFALYRFSDAARSRIHPFLEGRFEASRPVLWRVGLQIWQSSPWIGTGAASYNVLFDRHRPRGFLNEPEWAHNDYLNTLSDYGVGGFVLWFGAGTGLLWLGWRAVKQARRARLRTSDWRWKLGLWLGLFAFAAHLMVDFLTKVPALTFIAGTAMGLLLRDEEPLLRRWHRSPLLRGMAAITAVAIAIAFGVKSDRLYRAEALRYEPRRSLDRWGEHGSGDLGDLVKSVLPLFREAAAIDPGNGQAWADQAYATQLMWHVSKGDSMLLGLLARESAMRAIELCAVDAEFWIRKGSAEDMQARRQDAEASFRRALQLAPNNPEYWYYYAFHLAALTGRETAAQEAIATCLSLDPSYTQAIALRERLAARPFRN